MTLRARIAAHLAPDAHRAHKLRSVQVAGFGAIAGALAAGIAASGAILPWLGTIPDWMVYAGASLLFTLTVVARLWKQRL